MIRCLSILFVMTSVVYMESFAGDDKKSDDWKDVGETHRPSGALGHGSSVPPGYVPAADEGRPPH